jgi:anti-sigma factor RsiW
VVDPAYLQTILRDTFYPKPSPPRPHHRGLTGSRSTTVDVLNGGSTTGLAARVSAALAGAGFRAGQVGNTGALTSTVVRYGPAAPAAAGPIAALFGATAVASNSVAAHHVEILLGAGATLPHIPASGTSPAPGATVIPTTGPQGGAVIAKNGIPCVN